MECKILKFSISGEGGTAPSPEPTPRQLVPVDRNDKSLFHTLAAIDEGKAVLLTMANSPSDVARLLAVSSPHAGDWLNALPISSCGLRLDDDVVRVGVGLRLILQIYESHRCVRDSMVDQQGLHALSCKFEIGRRSRHGMLNDIVHRAFTSAGIPAMKEPTDLVKECALRLDGLTLIPWAEGRSLAWDVTVTHTLAPTNLVHSVHVAGSAAEAAADRKLIKYASLSPSHLFVPVSLETHGHPAKRHSIFLWTSEGASRKEQGTPGKVRSSFKECLSLYSGATQRLSMADSVK